MRINKNKISRFYFSLQIDKQLAFAKVCCINDKFKSSFDYSNYLTYWLKTKLIQHAYINHLECITAAFADTCEILKHE